PDPLAHLVGVDHGVEAADLDRPGRGPKIAGQDAQCRGLPGTVEAEKPDGLAVADLETHGPERAFATVELGEIGCADHRSSRRAIGAESMACSCGTPSIVKSA